jgi:hypothetical protein
MEPNQPTHPSFHLTSSALLSLVGHLSDFPNPDDPNPPGPWGPVIRRAAERVRFVLGPSPDPWNELFSPVPDPWRVAFAQALVQEVIDRAMLMQEVADALPNAGETHGIIIIGGFLSRFIDGCGTGRIKRPLPPPRHHGDGKLSSQELVVMAAQFEQSAAATDNEGIRREFRKAGNNLLEIGVRGLQSTAASSAG